MINYDIIKYSKDNVNFYKYGGGIYSIDEFKDRFGTE